MDINRWAVCSLKQALDGIENILRLTEQIQAIASRYSSMGSSEMRISGSMDFLQAIIKAAIWGLLMILPIISISVRKTYSSSEQMLHNMKDGFMKAPVFTGMYG